MTTDPKALKAILDAIPDMARSGVTSFKCGEVEVSFREQMGSVLVHDKSTDMAGIFRGPPGATPPENCRCGHHRNAHSHDIGPNKGPCTISDCECGMFWPDDLSFPSDNLTPPQEPDNPKNSETGDEPDPANDGQPIDPLAGVDLDTYAVD